MLHFDWFEGDVCSVFKVNEKEVDNQKAEKVNSLYEMGERKTKTDFAVRPLRSPE
jgi:hypothetical protein